MYLEFEILFGPNGLVIYYEEKICICYSSAIIIVPLS